MGTATLVLVVLALLLVREATQALAILLLALAILARVLLHLFQARASLVLGTQVGLRLAVSLACLVWVCLCKWGSQSQ
jgi:hypothetical protein